MVEWRLHECKPQEPENAAVSLRDITTEAGVTLALASYHFGTKEHLFEEVVARRANILCEIREARLAALQEPDTRTILDAFMAPLFEKASAQEPGWPAYFQVLSRLGEGDDWLHLLAGYFDATGQSFIAALEGALPGADHIRVSRGFAVTLHAMLAIVSQNGRVTTLTGGEVPASDLSAAYPALLDFVTAGFEAMR